LTRRGSERYRRRPDTDSNNYDRRWIERSAFSVTAIQEVAGRFIATFKDFPPHQKPAKFNVDDVMVNMYKTGAH
jgi:arylsulfatase